MRQGKKNESPRKIISPIDTLLLFRKFLGKISRYEVALVQLHGVYWRMNVAGVKRLGNICKNKTMTLRPDSPLNFLPKEIGHKQLMLFDSLRFTLEMLDYNYSQLIKNLEDLSCGKENKIHYKIFNYAWGLIDHGQRFYLLYKKLNPPENIIIEKINYIYSFRNAIQHLDKNVECQIIANFRPIYGTLKWIVNDTDKKEIYTSLLVSGIFEIDKLEFEQHGQAGYHKFINEVKLETDTLGKKNENEINLCKMIEDISFVTDKLDAELSKRFRDRNFQLLDWKSRKDVLLNMKNPNVA
ncbi:MAG TPA: hypothetical protein VFU15_07190 [Bacteroidia bacterium]|nr:hypothetical protein [Bacteroidia bacterium]